ncbi:uncharacterized protein QC761_103380 [Podospora bellae-mahoneyi]|uniref:Uncharacterized protein n=1 Tax=Podospora bellae-mahoneyi TaxID=2093777 RepID=A0ABR0FXI6_9PEZI|nr:hypothetical protein QC761_103380 [Podospora bellae-mahoneyi]
MHLLLLIVYIIASRDIGTLAAPAPILNGASSQDVNEKNGENNIFPRKIYHRADDPQNQTSVLINPPLGTGPLNSTIANATSVVSLNITLSAVTALTTTPVTLTLASPSSGPSQGPIIVTSESPLVSQGPPVITSVSPSATVIAASTTVRVGTPIALSPAASVSGSTPSPIILTLSPPPPTPILVTITPIPVNTVTVILSPISNPSLNPTLAIPPPGSTITVTAPVSLSPTAAGSTITVTLPTVIASPSGAPASTITISLPTVIASTPAPPPVSTITVTVPFPAPPISFISTKTITVTGSPPSPAPGDTTIIVTGPPPSPTIGDTTITISAIPISIPTTPSPLPPPPPTPVIPPAAGEEGGRTVTLVETVPVTSFSNGMPVSTIWQESTSLVVIPQVAPDTAVPAPPPPSPVASDVNTAMTTPAPVVPGGVLTVTVTAPPPPSVVPGGVLTVTVTAPPPPSVVPGGVVADAWTTVVFSADNTEGVPILTTVALAAASPP